MSPEKPGGLERRALMSRIGAGAAGAAAISAMAAGGLALSAPPAQAQAVNDVAIANFALNLEYLEAEFYLRATTGQGLAAADVTGTGTQGGVTGGRAVPFRTSAIQQYAMEITNDEVDHVRFLRSVLGANAVAEPAIDLTNSFNTLAVAAGLGSSFDPFASEDNFLLGAYIFEDVGVTAYHGAAPLIQNRAVLSAAAGVLAVEAYHAALIRVQLFQLGFALATQKISALRAALSGAADDFGVVVNGTSNIVLTDSNSNAFSRTPRQVLNIVYGGVNAASGLFYPSGLNGAIR